mmetsp:Transcript_48779/g.115935  ORF Transcript_48779/g.115935 Transcript_48779/m.115935 type:complete len:89 (-) Transcript_48779:1730-1996(-)
MLQPGLWLHSALAAARATALRPSHQCTDILALALACQCHQFGASSSSSELLRAIISLFAVPSVGFQGSSNSDREAPRAQRSRARDNSS